MKTLTQKMRQNSSARRKRVEARAAGAGKFELLPVEWTAESEELTPTLKLKRRVVHTKYSDVVDRLYG